jgi:RING-box protein 2
LISTKRENNLEYSTVQKYSRNKMSTSIADENENTDRIDSEATKNEKMFTLKKWNAVAMWSWDVECDTCAICRVQVMDACLRCQAESKKDSYGKQDCVVVWGECNHSFHYCCMSLWVKQNNRFPLFQQEWSIQRMGK